MAYTITNIVTPARAYFVRYRRAYGLKNNYPNVPLQTLIDSWTGTCCAPHYYILNKRHICGITISLITRYSTEGRARFDPNSQIWLCAPCYYKKYPKKRRSDAVKPSRKKLSNIDRVIANAKEIYETTGIRYADSGFNGKTQKRKLREIFDQSKANKNLTRTFNRSWVWYRCPHCDFYRCARAYQGYPPHPDDKCPGRNGWK